MSRLFASRIGKLGAAICIAVESLHAFAVPMTGVVVDANGVAMGPYYPSVNADLGSRAGVLLNLGGQPVLLPLNPGRLNADPVGLLPGGNEEVVFFESADCSGQAWLHATRSSVPGTAQAAISNSKGAITIYVPSKEFLESRAMKSHLRSSICGKGAKEMLARRVEQVIDLSSLYVAPYHL